MNLASAPTNMSTGAVCLIAIVLIYIALMASRKGPKK